jgi:hypothetical protein
MKQFWAGIALLALSATLAACAGQNGNSGGVGVQLVKVETAGFNAAMADLGNADKVAQANNDALAHTCFAYLETAAPKIQAQLAGVAATPPNGVFSAFEITRVGVANVKGAVTGVPQAFEVACGPLVLDAGNNVIAVLAAVGVKVAPLAALPAL